MKKRFAAAVCLIATALSLSACGGSGQTETTAAAESTTAAPAAGVPAGGKVVRVAAVDPQVALDPQQYTYCYEDHRQCNRVSDYYDGRRKSGA